MIKCDCCGRELKDGENPYKVPLPYRYRCKVLWTNCYGKDGYPLDSYKTKMKNYDFCEDCYNGFGEMMYVFAEEPFYFNTLFPNIAFIGQNMKK